MTRQGKQIPSSKEKEKYNRHKNDIWTIDSQKTIDAANTGTDANDNQATNSEKGLNDKSIRPPRNAFFQLDLDAIALRMKKDLTDRCCCADVPCVSIIKEYCESR